LEEEGEKEGVVVAFPPPPPPLFSLSSPFAISMLKALALIPRVTRGKA
jgi:hypothetical protein